MTWTLYALLAAVCAGCVAVFGKIGIQGVDVTIATTARALIMAVFLVSVSFALGKFHFLGTIQGRSLFFIALSGIAGALSWLFYFLALQKGPASAVAALDRLSVVCVLIFAVLFLGESINWKTGFGAFLLTVGAILMTLK